MASKDTNKTRGLAPSTGCVLAFAKRTPQKLFIGVLGCLMSRRAVKALSPCDKVNKHISVMN